MRAVLFDGERLRLVDDLEVRPPRPGEVEVRVLASGICHSDLNVVDGTSPVPAPVVLGHEAGGVIERLGEAGTGGTGGPGEQPGHAGSGDGTEDGTGAGSGTGRRVEGLHVGQAVLVSSMTPCRACRACADGRPSDCAATYASREPMFTWRGSPVRSYANIASFAERIVVRADQVIAADGLPAAAAALVGCAVSTGYGVVRNVARVQAGDTVVVIGVGGIGVNAIQTAARIEGAARVIAVDVNPAKESAALGYGAHVFVLAPRDGDSETIAGLVRDVAGRATTIDVVIECSGAPVAIDAAIRIVGVGGTVALVGIPPPGFRAALDVGALLRGRRIVGSLNGACEPRRDLPAIVEHARHGRLTIADQVSQVWPLTEFDAAIDAVRHGSVVRAVLSLAD